MKIIEFLCAESFFKSTFFGHVQKMFPKTDVSGHFDWMIENNSSHFLHKFMIRLGLYSKLDKWIASQQFRNFNSNVRITVVHVSQTQRIDKKTINIWIRMLQPES